MNTLNRWRVPAPNPDNASAWEVVLDHYNRAYETQGAEGCAWLCPLLERLCDEDLLSVREYHNLQRELNLFLRLVPECYYLCSVARAMGVYPYDLALCNWPPLSDHFEFRKRFIRWRAGLEIGGVLPWAQMAGEPA